MDDIAFDTADFTGPGCRRVSFADRGVIFVKGDRGDFAYLVLSGTVEIRHRGRVIEALGPGGLFGEKALIDSHPRAASAVAVGPTELAVIDRASFERMVEEVPGFAVKVMRLMAKRLRTSNESMPAPAANPLPPRLRTA